MRTFKIVDFWISVNMIITVLILGAVKGSEFLFLGYFIVGGWQLISMVIHFTKKWYCTRGTKRNNYHFAIFLMLLYSCAGFISSEALFPLLVILLFSAPFQAIFYCWLCWNELSVKMKRPLSELK